MRYTALIVVIAVIYLIATRFSPVNSTAEAMREADAVTKISGMETTDHVISPSSSLRAPLDRTRATIEKIRKDRVADEF